VDYNDGQKRKRYPKQSARWFKKFLKRWSTCIQLQPRDGGSVSKSCNRRLAVLVYHVGCSLFPSVLVVRRYDGVISSAELSSSYTQLQGSARLSDWLYMYLQHFCSIAQSL
jgi:hypothetical protein